MEPVLSELAERLRTLTGPDRRTDVEIAMLVGYRREVNEIERRVLWFDPKGGDPVRIPPYTGSIDHARDFAKFVAPNHVGGCSWEKGKGSARIDNGPYFESVSPEIALCMAAVNAKMTRDMKGTR